MPVGTPANDRKRGAKLTHHSAQGIYHCRGHGLLAVAGKSATVVALTGALQCR